MKTVQAVLICPFSLKLQGDMQLHNVAEHLPNSRAVSFKAHQKCH
jgi:hypothetical protein